MPTSNPSSPRPVITILGSGTSQGVPMIACTCPVCTSADPHDNRTRCSIWITTPEASLIVDTPPEFRVQSIREKIPRVDAVLVTHGHADHVMGFDDLRRFCDVLKGPMPLYASQATLDQLERAFPYAFDPSITTPGYVRVDPHPHNGTFSLGGWSVTPVPVKHGRCITHGYLFVYPDGTRFGYFSDVKAFTPEARDMLTGVDLLIVDGLRDETHPTHFSIAEAVSFGREIGAGITCLTHLTHQKSHVDRTSEAPQGVIIAHDGLKITL